MMAKRPTFERPLTDIKRSIVGSWTSDDQRVVLASKKAFYRGSGRHKSYPSPSKEWVINTKTDLAKCDKFSEKDWPKLQQTLRAAIRAGCTSGTSDDAFPFRAWAYINNVLHEARRTNTETGEYHAFPLDYKEHHPQDPQNLLKKAPRVDIAVV